MSKFHHFRRQNNQPWRSMQRGNYFDKTRQDKTRQDKTRQDKTLNSTKKRNVNYIGFSYDIRGCICMFLHFLYLGRGDIWSRNVDNACSPDG